MGEPVGPRRAVPVPTARQAPCAAGGPSRGPPTRIQLLGPSVDSDYLQHVSNAWDMWPMLVTFDCDYYD